MNAYKKEIHWPFSWLIYLINNVETWLFQHEHHCDGIIEYQKENN